MRTSAWIAATLVLCASASAQSAGPNKAQAANGAKQKSQDTQRENGQRDRGQSVQERLADLERQLAELKKQGAVGRGGRTMPTDMGTEFRASGLPLGQEGVASQNNEKVKIGGRLDFEFYDLHASRTNFGNYGGNQFGNTNGGTEFRIRRLQLALGLEVIEDLKFHGTLTLDPVVRDQDEGAVDIDEAYVRFDNFFLNIFDVEDPTNSFIQVGNFYRWEREFFERRSEAFSLAGTSFYRDEITGLRLGGDADAGFSIASA